MSEKSKKQKVSIVEKMGLFMVCAGNIPLMGLLSGFFMIYYTNVVGLEPAALATLFLISKVVDGISDPIMGYFLDKFPVTKMGKFRPMIILGTIICVINYILLWFGAVWIPVGKYVIVYVTYLLLGWTFDIMDISKNSLLPVMSADDKERNSLSLFNALGTMIGSAVLAVAAPILVAEGTLQNYYVLIFGSMAMVLVLSIAGALCVKERVAFEGKKEESYTFRELLQFLRYKPVWALFLVALVVGVGSNIAGGAGAYFYTYILGDMTLMSGVSLVSMITTLVGIFLGPILANRFGKKQIFVMAIVVSILFSALRLIDVRSMLLIYISTVAGGVAGGCLEVYRQALLSERVGDMQSLTVFTVNSDNPDMVIQDEQKAGGKALGMMLPYFVTILLFAGAMGLGTDMVAGEKERGTMASMLVAPIKRSSIVLGKVFALMIISGISSVVYVAVMVGFLPQMMGAYGSEGLGLSLEVGQVLMMAFLLIAIAFLYSGIIVLISVFAKDTKEANSYIMPVYMLILILGIATMFTTQNIESWYYAVPVFNTALALQGILTGDVSVMQYAVTLAETLILGMILITVIAKAFESEKVMAK
jgi:Na+/melibiose symporter-like transporter/ABC-type transport system involved in multi-copper enzyme maturation permease subunit